MLGFFRRLIREDGWMYAFIIHRLKIDRIEANGMRNKFVTRRGAFVGSV